MQAWKSEDGAVLRRVWAQSVITPCLECIIMAYPAYLPDILRLRNQCWEATPAWLSNQNWPLGACGSIGV